MARKYHLWGDHHGGSLTLLDHRGEVDYPFPEVPFELVGDDIDPGNKGHWVGHLKLKHLETLSRVFQAAADSVPAPEATVSLSVAEMEWIENLCNPIRGGQDDLQSKIREAREELVKSCV